MWFIKFFSRGRLATHLAFNTRHIFLKNHQGETLHKIGNSLQDILQLLHEVLQDLHKMYF